jgi:hypothetical protein
VKAKFSVGDKVYVDGEGHDVFEVVQVINLEWEYGGYGYQLKDLDGFVLEIDLEKAMTLRTL